MDKRLFLITALVILLLASLYKNYTQYMDNSQAKSRLAKITEKGNNAIAQVIKTDSSDRTVYTNVLAKTDDEKRLATGQFVDTLSTFLKVPVGQIEEVTRVKVIKYDTVKVTVVQDSAQNKIFSYANRWLTAKLTTKDSTLQYSYSVELADYQYSKGILFWKKRYREITLVDPSAKIVGVQRFTMPVSSPSRLGLGVIGGVDMQGRFLVGLGLSYQLIRF